MGIAHLNPFFLTMRSILIAGFVAIYSFGQAQINESDTIPFQLQARIGGSLQTGNVELIRILGSLESSIRFAKDNWVFKSQNEYLYQRISKRKADNGFNSWNFLYFRPENRFYPYAIVFNSTNFRRDIDHRAFGGIGGTLQLLIKANHNIKLSLNGLYESTNYAVPSFNIEALNGLESVDTWMYSLYISGFHHLNERTIGLLYQGYLLMSFSESDIWRYHLFGGLDFKIWKGLSVQTRIDFTHENLIVAPNKKDDFLWTWGVKYRLNKK